MRRIRTHYLLLATVFFLLWPPNNFLLVTAGSAVVPLATHQPLAIIVNRSNPIENLSSAELRKIFLGERYRWENGHRVTVTMLDPGFPERESMLRFVYRMTESEYRDHFLKGTYTGDIPVSPKTLSSPETLRKFVFNAPGAIGYLRRSDVDGSVKVVSIDGHFPGDLEYKLLIEGPNE
jgi:ABC-type phosphate transport system substrate-binding protein